MYVHNMYIIYSCPFIKNGLLNTSKPKECICAVVLQFMHKKYKENPITSKPYSLYFLDAVKQNFQYPILDEAFSSE